MGELGEDFFVLFGEHLVGFGEALAIGEGLAIVDDRRGESGEHRDLGDAFRDVAAAENEGAGLGNHGFDEHAELSSADQAVVVSGVLAQAEVHLARALGFHDFARGVPDLGFDAAAADGAEHGAVLAHQQFGAFVAGDGAVDLDDGGEGALLAEPAQADDFLVDVHSFEL